MDETTIVYLAASAMVVLLALLQAGSFGVFMIPMVVIAVLALLLILLINYADFLIFPLVTVILNMKIIPAKNYYIPKHQNCVIKNVNGLYYATGYLTANLYNYVFTMEQGEDEDTKMSEAPSKWERIMMSIKFPFKYNLIVFSQDIQEYRESLEGKLGLLEFKLSKEMSSQNPSQMAIDDLQRQIRITQTRIDRLSMGEKPVQSLMYIETVAVGVSEKAATDSLMNQLNQLQVIFNALDINIMRVTGREVYLLFNFNYFTPATPNELMSKFALQK